MRYDALFTHRLLIRDSARTEAFARAIAQTVRPGDVVLDVGAGSGILSLLAAKAGAGRVYAVEPTDMAGLCHQLAARNGFEQTIQVIQAPIQAIQPVERVDVIVAEWLGTIGVDENLLGAVLWARDHWLKAGGSLIPATVTAWMAPVFLAINPEVRFFHDRPYGLDLAALAEPSVHELLLYRRPVRPESLVAPAQQLWTTNVERATPEQARRHSEAALTFTIQGGSACNALAAWFEAELAPGVLLSNGPQAPDTHWGQLLIPLERALRPEADKPLEVQFACIPSGPERSQLTWAVRLGAGPWERHDTRSIPAPPRETPHPTAGPRGADDGVRQRGAQTPMASALSSFLARLAVDHGMLLQFIEQPVETMRRAGLSEADQQAMISRDQSRIQLALQQSAPAGAQPRPAPAPSGTAPRAAVTRPEPAGTRSRTTVTRPEPAGPPAPPQATPAASRPARRKAR